MGGSSSLQHREQQHPFGSYVTPFDVIVRLEKWILRPLAEIVAGYAETRLIWSETNRESITVLPRTPRSRFRREIKANPALQLAPRGWRLEVRVEGSPPPTRVHEWMRPEIRLYIEAYHGNGVPDISSWDCSWNQSSRIVLIECTVTPELHFCDCGCGTILGLKQIQLDVQRIFPKPSKVKTTSLYTNWKAKGESYFLVASVNSDVPVTLTLLPTEKINITNKIK